MKLNLKSVMVGCVIGGVVMSVIPAMGYDGTKTIQAVFKNIKICVDGVAMTPRDTAGKEVTYDGSTNTVYLGKSGTIAYAGQQVKSYQKTGSIYEDTATIGGTKYYNSIYHNSIFNTKDTIYYNLNGMYNSMSGVYGILD